MATDWVKFMLNIQPELAKAVERWRGQQYPIPDRNEAIRRLVMKGLQQDGMTVLLDQQEIMDER